MCMCVCMRVCHSYVGTHGGQKKVLDSLELGYRCWESNSGSLEDQQALLITEPSLQNPLSFPPFKKIGSYNPSCP